MYKQTKFIHFMAFHHLISRKHKKPYIMCSEVMQGNGIVLKSSIHFYISVSFQILQTLQQNHLSHFYIFL